MGGFWTLHKCDYHLSRVVKGPMCFTSIGTYFQIALKSFSQLTLQSLVDRFIYFTVTLPASYLPLLKCNMHSDK